MSSRDLTTGRAIWRALLCAASVLVLAGSVVLGDEPKADTKPQTQIKISKETTYITGPLTDRGYVDYPGWLNRKMSEGVTPENNAAVLYWQAIGPNKGISADYRKFVVDQLGVDVFAGDGPFLVSLEEFVERQKVRHPDLDKEAFKTMLETAHGGPWKESDLPLVAEWVRVNETPLRRVIAGSKQPQYFSPIEATMIVGARMPHLILYRDTNHLLLARAMLNLKRNDLEAVNRDLLGLHRFAIHVSRGATAIDWLVGLAVRDMATKGVRRLALSGRLTAAQLTSLREELAALGNFSQYRDIINTGQRLESLDLIQWIARAIDEKPGDEKWVHIFFVDGKEDDPVVVAMNDVLYNSKINWNEAVKTINQRYDVIEKAMKLPTVEKGRAALEGIDKELKHISGVFRSFAAPVNIPLLKTMSAKQRGEQLGLRIVSNNRSFIDWGPVYDDLVAMQAEATQLGLAILIYRKTKGHLPEKLEELVPDLIDSVPKDSFSGKPFLYRHRGDEFSVYSVGENVKDDGGIGRIEAPDQDDIVFATDGWK